jgi:hypothetical protein
MVRIITNRSLSIAIVAVILVGGCAAQTPPLPTPTPVAIETTTPSAPAIATASPTPITTPTPTTTPAATAPPAAASWVEVRSQPSTSNVEFRDVVWTETRFVAVGWAYDARGESTTGVFLDSTDGVTWNRQNGGFATSVAAGPGGVVAVGGMGASRTSWTSVDGLTWVAHPNAFPAAPDGSTPDEDTVRVTDVVARGGGWLAVGRRDPSCQFDCDRDPSRAYVWRSDDGAHWTRVADQRAFAGGGMDALATGTDGFVAAGIASGHAAMWTSPDGVAWSRVPDDAMFHAPTSSGLIVDASGVVERDGTIVVIGSALGQDVSTARAWWSTNGRTWSKASVAAAADGQLSGVAVTPQGFLAAGWSEGCEGGIWASADGRSWHCDLSDPGADGFVPAVTVSSDRVEVALGATNPADEDVTPATSAIWSRSLR